MRQILIAVVVLALCGIAAAEAPEDPYLWLEEVEGEKALDWVKDRSAQDTAVLEAVPVYSEIHEKLLEIYNSSDRIPSVSIRGSWLYNFWRDADHVRGHLAAHLPRGVHQGRTVVGDRPRSRRPRRGRGRELGVEGVQLPAARVPPLHDHPVARRQRRGGRARVRRRRQGLRRGRFRPSRGQGAGELEGRGHVVGRHRFR